MANQIHRERELKLTFENEYKTTKMSLNSLQQELEKYKSEYAFIHNKLMDTEKKLDQQVSTLNYKKTSSNNVVKEYECRLEELVEEKENWRDLLYQEKQTHAQTKEKCNVIS